MSTIVPFLGTLKLLMPRHSLTSGRLFSDPASLAGGDALVSLEGSLESVTFRNEENGFTIARLRTFDREVIPILGTIINPVLGESLQVWGKWETHKQYGPQFRIERYQVHKPATAAGMEKYLGSGLIKGIGPRTAKILVAHFGLDTIDVIEKNPERLQEVPGIGKQKARWILQAWDEQREVRHIMLFLQGHGISATYAAKIYRTYGDRAVEIVSENPYRLAQDVFGIGFKMADRIAQKLGLARNTPERIQAGVLFSLRQAAEQGHCFQPEDMLVASAIELLSSPPDDTEETPTDNPTPEAIKDAVERLARAQLIIRDTDAGEPVPVYLKSLFLTELSLARNLRTIIDEELHSPWLPDDLDGYVQNICDGMGITLATQQQQAVLEALRSRIMVLTGGPGTGKTTTTRAILQAHLRCGRKVLLASPTGRAAKRLAEVTSYPAQTIHRLLEVDPTSFTFKRNQENPLECDTLIVDEVSMVDLHLAHSLIRALPEDAQIILVGDADQLPSVGAGNVLHDLIASTRIPVIWLTEVFRQAAESTIITNAHRVNHGMMPELPPTSQWKTADCLFINQNDPLVAADKVCDVVCRSLPSLWYTPEEIQVLTPMQRGTLGAVNLNSLLQAALNPKQLGVDEFSRGQKTLRCGDRVIQTVNNYQKEVFNGDIGYIRHIDAEEKEFVVEYPDREVEYSFDDADELLLAYALTVHKSQGSEYAAVVLVFHTQHYMLLQRNLLYTALTRAKKQALIIGSKRAIGMAVRNERQLVRYTRLAERLQEEAPVEA
ncbi:MAG TPA: ATP-dependent RecD-like DNA helicase [Armatimonadota bacterium]|nr:ATP-dependent RecD-like DNA helicase [Armatimonadota bacterium]